MKTSKTSLIILVVIIIIAAIFLVFDQIHAPNSPSVTSSSTASTSTSSSSIDTSNWKAYANTQPPFGIKYPADLTFSTDVVPTIDGPYLLALQFPKAIYFSTVLKDEAYVIVTASSSCPTIEPSGLPGINNPQTVVFPNGLTFVQHRIDDVAAGNRYETLVYDTIKDNICYRITFFDHGANGAGLYLSDMNAINVANSIHDAELIKIEAIVTEMIDTFTLNTSK